MAFHLKQFILVLFSLSTLFILFLFVTNDRTKCVSSFKSQSDWTKTLNASLATPQQVIDFFYWTNASSCRLAHDFGGKMMKNPSGFDGQKSICLDPEVAPRSGNCVVYSFGINNEWSFDDIMEQYGCQVFAFDPSMSAKDHNRSEMIKFFRTGLGDRDYINQAHWKINTLRTIYQNLGHEGKTIDYLKMDIETSEWTVLPQILKSGMLAKIRQLAVEFHWPGNHPLDRYRSMVSTIQMIEDAGMIRFDSKSNPWFLDKAPVLNDYYGSMGFEIAWYQVIPFD